MTEAHRYLMCIQYRTTIDKFDGPEVSGRYLKDDESMRRGWFADHPEPRPAARSRSVVRCRWSSASITCRRFAPGRNEEEEAARHSLGSLEKRFAELEETGAYAYDKAVFERLDHELAIINLWAFQLLLIVQIYQLGERPPDSRRPGAGFRAGSCAWALRITDLDPLPYDPV